MPALAIMRPRDILSCDHCNRPADEWPSGLMSIDRELGMFGGDFTVCPVCVPTCTFGPDALTGQIQSGIQFEHITWFWFDAPCRDCKQPIAWGTGHYIDTDDFAPFCDFCYNKLRYWAGGN